MDSRKLAKDLNWIGLLLQEICCKDALQILSLCFWHP